MVKLILWDSVGLEQHRRFLLETGDPEGQLKLILQRPCQHRKSERQEQPAKTVWRLGNREELENSNMSDNIKTVVKTMPNNNKKRLGTGKGKKRKSRAMTLGWGIPAQSL